MPDLGVISSITLKYKLSKFFGDPPRQAVFAYYADFNISSAFWVAQVMTTSGDPVMVNGKLVYAGWLEGSWPKPGGTFGTNSTGSPWWYETFSYYSGRARLPTHARPGHARVRQSGGGRRWRRASAPCERAKLSPPSESTESGRRSGTCVSDVDNIACGSS